MTEPDWAALGQRWWSHVRALADDRLEGRGTGSRGFQRAADYVIEQFRAAGLQPAGVDGFRQPVDFHLTEIDPAHSGLSLVQDGRAAPLSLSEDAAIIVTSKTEKALDAAAVFVGYGLTIPELGYDDFAGLDVKGKAAVYLRGGPANLPGPIRAHYQSPDERVKILRNAGAVASVGILNPTVPELPWSRLAAWYLQPRLELKDPGHAVPAPLPLSVLVPPERAEPLFAGSGRAFSEMVALLGTDRSLPRFPLAVTLRAQVHVTRRYAVCQNLVGVLPGHDPELRKEYVVLSAHLDHLGLGEAVEGDRVYAGAIDNASGVASLLEIARAMKVSGAKPKRSILFLAVTGEEKGLLGSQYFAAHPTVSGPIVANLNVDGVLPLFPLRFLEVMGLDESTLGDDLRAVAQRHDVGVHAEYEPDRVLFIRSDQYSFIKEGVPALFPGFGYERGTQEETLTKDWYRDRYHGPADDPDQPVDAAAGARFNALVEELTLRVADAKLRPQWKPDSFFRRFAK